MEKSKSIISAITFGFLSTLSSPGYAMNSSEDAFNLSSKKSFSEKKLDFSSVVCQADAWKHITFLMYWIKMDTFQDSQERMRNA